MVTDSPNYGTTRRLPDRAAKDLLEPDDGESTQPTNQRSINFAALAPGSHRFNARSSRAEHTISSRETIIAVEVRQHPWQRALIVALGLALTVSTDVAAFSLRKARRLPVDRIRSGIAADLHDDVGATLTQLVLLSEKIRKAAVIQDLALSGDASRMAAISRGLVDSLSDFVWAIDSGSDNLSDLSVRVRSYAAEMLEDGGLMLRFHGPEPTDVRRLRPTVRTHLYLIFKEALQNSVRHAHASAVSVSLEAGHKHITLIVTDDGIGFRTDRARGSGNGLQHMEARASAVGGTLHVKSGQGAGTTVRAEIPLAFERRFTKASHGYDSSLGLEGKSKSRDSTNRWSTTGEGPCGLNIERGSSSEEIRHARTDHQTRLLPRWENY